MTNPVTKAVEQMSYVQRSEKMLRGRGVQREVVTRYGHRSNRNRWFVESYLTTNGLSAWSEAARRGAWSGP